MGDFWPLAVSNALWEMSFRSGCFFLLLFFYFSVYFFILSSLREPLLLQELGKYNAKSEALNCGKYWYICHLCYSANELQMHYQCTVAITHSPRHSQICPQVYCKILMSPISILSLAHPNQLTIQCLQVNEA